MWQVCVYQSGVFGMLLLHVSSGHHSCYSMWGFVHSLWTHLFNSNLHCASRSMDHYTVNVSPSVVLFVFFFFWKMEINVFSRIVVHIMLQCLKLNPHLDTDLTCHISNCTRARVKPKVSWLTHLSCITKRSSITLLEYFLKIILYILCKCRCYI